jgi:hypothetical protein
MNQQSLFIFGIILLCLGCIAGLYLALTITGARVSGVFSLITSDSPVNRFNNLRCPLLMSKGETGSVIATIANPTGDSLAYNVSIEARDMSVLTPGEELTVTVSGSQTKVSWAVMATEAGNQAIAVQALSSLDLALPGQPVFHTWPTSFRESCGIRVTDLPLTGRQIILLDVACVVIGAAMSFPRLYRRRQQQM